VLFCSDESKDQNKKDYCGCAFDKFMRLGIYNENGEKLVSEKSFNEFVKTKAAENVNYECDKKFPQTDT
jgi:hypothetical protein